MNQIEVIIMGNSYLLSCPDGSEATIRQAVARVDREMTAIKDAGKHKARERIAVLTALNLAFEQLLATTDTIPNDAATASHPHTKDSLLIDQLVQRIDKVLQSDGHLF